MCLCVCFQKNVSLKMLNLAWNGFANEGAVALGKALEKNRTLKSLDISNNRIGIVGIRALIKGLKQNEGISSLKVIVEERKEIKNVYVSLCYFSYYLYGCCSLQIQTASSSCQIK